LALNGKRLACSSFEASRLLLSNKEQKWSNRSLENDEFAASSGVGNTRRFEEDAFTFAPSSDGISRMPKRRLKVWTFVTSLEITWCTSRWVSMLNGKLRFKCNKFQDFVDFDHCGVLYIRLKSYVPVQYSTVRCGTVRTSQTLRPKPQIQNRL
jgi:hypothetical protein